MPKISLTFSNVCFGYGTREPLFDDFSCTLANGSGEGKVVAVMGPSGVGKTTFCDLALGVRRPKRGIIRFETGSANAAVIPQKGILFEELSVRDNIACLRFSRSLGATFRGERVQQAIDALGLSSVIKEKTATGALSGGEAQRVMLARIQTVACDFLVLDEPCSFLDNRVKDSFLAALRATVDEQKLLALMVTHVWDEAAIVADEVIFFHRVPGQPVSLHRRSPAAARSRPPTLESLFGIHWPNCAIIDVAAFTDLAPREHRLNGASHVGLFWNAGCQAGRDDLGGRLSAALSRGLASGLNGGLRRLVDGIGTDVEATVLFYDKDGVIIHHGG